MRPQSAIQFERNKNKSSSSYSKPPTKGTLLKSNDYKFNKQYESLATKQPSKYSV